MEEPAPQGQVSGLPATVALFIGLLLTGCANPGPPRPPSLQLPAIVKDLSASRIGNRVILRWTTPSKTTDNLDIKGPMVADICRSAGPVQPNAKKSVAACVAVQRVPTAPGASSAWDDLPQPLRIGPVDLLSYRVQILNAVGRSAGESTAAFAAAGTAPSPVESITATASEVGVVLHWKRPVPAEGLSVDFFRTDLTAPSASTRKSVAPAKLPLHPGKKSSPSRENLAEPNIAHLRAPATGKPGGDVAGTVDTTPAAGETYSYVAQQVQFATVDGQSLELRSEPSAAVTLVMRDTFAPKNPTGLATITGTNQAATGTESVPYIDLSWEPNTEPDLAGYFVYRQSARPNGDPQGPLGRLTALPIPAPAYRDVAVTPGQRYIYSVSAVDASGNESAPSARVQDVAAAQNGGSPQ